MSGQTYRANIADSVFTVCYWAAILMTKVHLFIRLLLSDSHIDKVAMVQP